MPCARNMRQLGFLFGMARAATCTLLSSDAFFSLSGIDCINRPLSPNLTGTNPPLSCCTIPIAVKRRPAALFLEDP